MEPGRQARGTPSLTGGGDGAPAAAIGAPGASPARGHRLTAPGDATEQAAARLEERAVERGALAGMSAATGPLPAPVGPGHGAAPLPAWVRNWAEPALGQDFGDVRLHTGPDAERSADALDASAFVRGRDVALGRAALEPGLDAAQQRRLLLHELAHIAGGLPGGTTARKTKGELAVEKAHTDWLDPQDTSKADVDVLKAALKEIAKGKSVEFNRKAAAKRITSALAAIGKSVSEPGAQDDWTWLVDHRAAAATAAYQSRRRTFLARFESPLAALSAANPKSQAGYWLRNTPSQVLDVIVAVASAMSIPATELWVYLNKEGLEGYVRRQSGVVGDANPTAAQLKAVSTTTTISGFNDLGTDDFWTDLDAKREPARAKLPSTFDLTKVTHSAHTNEKGRVVDSADFADLTTAVTAVAALLMRRRAVFLADAKLYGYAAPTVEETVYWTYVYYNSGEFNGQLKKYKGVRVLGDWITKNEFPHAIAALQSYRMIQAMKLF